MTKIKLYILTNLNGEIIALTEYKKYMRMYIIQNRYTDAEVQVYTMKDTEYCDKLLIENEDKILEDFEDYILTRRDVKPLFELISEEESRVNSVVYDLSFIYKNYTLSEKKSKKIRHAIEILSEFNVDGFIMKNFNTTLLDEDFYTPTQNKNEIINQDSMNYLLDKL